jgi:hypothetical protein
MILKRNNQIRVANFAVLMAVLLVFCATAGAVWHHHSSSTAETACPICHLGHQPYQHSVTSQSTPVLSVSGSKPVPEEQCLVPGLFSRRISVRAPPSSL